MCHSNGKFLNIILLRGWDKISNKTQSFKYVEMLVHLNPTKRFTQMTTLTLTILEDYHHRQKTTNKVNQAGKPAAMVMTIAAKLHINKQRRNRTIIAKNQKNWPKSVSTETMLRRNQWQFHGWHSRSMNEQMDFFRFISFNFVANNVVSVWYMKSWKSKEIIF